MKAWVQALIEDARAIASEGRRACEWLGEPVPTFLQGDPSPRTLELWAEARAIGGAYRFHQWAVRQLPPKVWEHYGEGFMHGANQLLRGNFSALSAAHNLFNEKPKPTAPLDCAETRCETDAECLCKSDAGKRADCLVRRFHCAYKSITAKRIAEWYSGLDGLAEKDVRAFLRVATPSDPLLRKAFGRILAQENVAGAFATGRGGGEGHDSPGGARAPVHNATRCIHAHRNPRGQ